MTAIVSITVPNKRRIFLPRVPLPMAEEGSYLPRPVAPCLCGPSSTGQARVEAVSRPVRRNQFGSPTLRTLMWK